MAKSKNYKQRTTDFDLDLSLELQQEYYPVGITENAVFPDHKNKENYQPRTLIDQTLEVIDPTPNIYTLFMQFNARFFSNKLLSVQVKWSKRMTSCAGVCSFHPRSRECIITLSAPLLKLRPRKDLVETLLHEMIHGYLFMTNNNRDRDGHGPEFCKHMDRINKEAGTRITIYHSFHDEVKLYQQHWWRCNGPCQKRHPYFGMVRRAMNRAPGPSDFWWKSHQQNCGGEFIKVKEPEKTNEKSKSQKSGDTKTKPINSSKGKNTKSLNDFFTQPTINPSTDVKNYNPPKNVTSNIPKATPAGLVKLGTFTNNVHGWGTGGPGSSSGKSPHFSKNNPTSVIGNPTRALNFGGTVGGVGTGRSNLLDKFSSPMAVPGSRPLKKPASIIVLDRQPIKKSKIDGSTSNGSEMLNIITCRVEQVYNCPVCKAAMLQSRLNDHLDVCLLDESKNSNNATPTAFNTNKKEENSVIEITSSPETPELPREARTLPAITPKRQSNLDGFIESPKKKSTKHVTCPVCNKSFEISLLNEHLDNCLTVSMNEENITKNRSKKLNPSAGPSWRTKSENFVDLTDKRAASMESYVCLVCNVRINGEIALNDHLDECVQAIFNDNTIDDEYNNSFDSSSPKTPVENDKFPCPICMESIPEISMNQHLDTCLSSEQWD